jgi:hypothetical protein
MATCHCPGPDDVFDLKTITHRKRTSADPPVKLVQTSKGNPMSQSRLSSFYEACINIVIGFTINFVANLWLIPAFTVGNDGQAAHLSWAANWWMGCVYTVISLVRSYTIRRWFNGKVAAAAQRLAGVS